MTVTNVLLCSRMNYAYLLTGGNIGNREEQLAEAARLLEENCGAIIDRSPLYETTPWGKTDQANFLNQALILQTSMSAKDLIREILGIETRMGRDRKEKFGPRIIDIDIIFFNHQIIDEPGLTVPHPEMSRRRFVLQPLAELIPAYIHPVYYKTVQQLLAECPDASPVDKIESQK